MKVALSTEAPKTVNVDLLAVAVSGSGWAKHPPVAALDKAMRGALVRLAKDEGFEGKPGERLRVPGSGSVKAAWILLVGTKRENVAHRMYDLGVAAAKAVRKQKTLAIVLDEDTEDAARAATQGLIGGNYRYTRYLTGPRKPTGGLKRASILVPEVTPDLRRGARAGEVVAESIDLARDLVNGPPNDVNPIALADFAREHCQKHGVQCVVWNKKKIEATGMNLFIAVNAGSAVEPRMVHMAYKPTKPSPHRVVFVGKGLTFDSGGLCLKPPKGMADMKCDMAGAATTLGVVLAAARLKLPVEVHGVIGATENMTGAGAYRPGDVFSSYEGKTVEIINTDAEGRLVLADVLAWARELEPTHLIDHATLTGACMVALGTTTAGLFSNDDELARRYQEAAERTGESYWRMPLTEDLREGLKSHIADLKHTGEPHGGAISAALFLQEFVGDCTWAHLDIAGPAHLDRQRGTMPKGGTGFGIATAISLLENLPA